MSFGEEAFACVAFPEKGFVFISEFVPEFVEVGVVRAWKYVSEKILAYLRGPTQTAPHDLTLGGLVCAG